MWLMRLAVRLNLLSMGPNTRISRADSAPGRNEPNVARESVIAAGSTSVADIVSRVEEDAQHWADLGFYDPTSTGADDRLALLRMLTARGATEEDLGRCISDLPALVNELRLRQPRLSLGSIAVQSGLPVEVAQQIARAAGFVVADPELEQFLPADVEVFALARVAIEMFGLEPSMQFGRVTAAALAQIADAAMTNFGQNVAPALEARQAGELAVAEATDAATGLLLDGVPTILNSLFRHACEAAMRRITTSGASATSELTVGFLDLVGSTALAERLSAEELGALISGFEREASERVAAIDGRVVKMIGDEVMFVTTDPLAACTLALDLADMVQAHPVLPSLRGGIAAGALVRGYGDYYGPVVNTASRAVKLAEPGMILATDEVRQRVDSSGLAFEPMGAQQLRGIETPVSLYRIRRT
jgi:adenylate cyclase